MLIVMKLLTWLELSKVSVREFAKMIGKNIKV